MPRVKGGTTARARRKKILKLAKGYVGSRSLLYRTAHEQVMKSLAYAYRDRKQRKREFRKLWISRINAAAKLNGFKYSKLIHGLLLANVKVNRKMLSEIAIHAPEDFAQYVAIAKDAINGTLPKPAKVNIKASEVKEAPKAKVIETVEKVDAPVKKAAPKKTVAKEVEGDAPVKKAAPKKAVAKEVEGDAPVKKAAPKKAAAKTE